MGFRWRTQRGLQVTYCTLNFSPKGYDKRVKISTFLQVLRINTKYNVLYVQGKSIPGDTGAYVYVYDTNVTHK